MTGRTSERLWPVPAIGIGTPRVESLSSYLVRLSCAHAIPTRVLVAHTFPELLGELGHVVERAAHGRRGVWMNGAGLWARKVSEAFETLTSQEGLRRLTMLPWRGVLFPRSLLAPVRRWCPDCYAEMRRERGECWDLLVWSLAAVRCCARHRKALDDRCPRCGREQPWLSSDTALGRCAVCGEDLATGQPSGCHAEPAPFQVWCADVCGEMLAFGVASEEACDASRLSGAVAGIVDLFDGGNVSAFARRVGVTPNAVRHWRDVGTIHLDLLLVMCGCVGLRPVEPFGDRDLAAVVRFSGSTPAGSAVRGTRWVRRDWDEVGLQFEECVRENPSVPFKEVAATLGVNEALLRERLRDRVSAWAARKRKNPAPPKKAKVQPADS